jgi:hypothetical protein
VSLSGSHCSQDDQAGTSEEKAGTAKTEPEQPWAQKRTIFCHPKTINIKLRPKTDYSYGCLETSGNLFEPPASLEAARKPPETLDNTSLLEGSEIPLEASEPLAAGEPVGSGRGVVAAGRFPPGLSSLCNGLVLQRSYEGPSTNEALRARTEPASTPLKSPGPTTLD